MRVVNVEDAVIGQIISEPVISTSGVLICNPGTPISRTLKRSLPNFGIHKVQIKAVIGDQLLTDILGGNKMNMYSILVDPITKHETIWTKITM